MTKEKVGFIIVVMTTLLFFVIISVYGGDRLENFGGEHLKPAKITTNSLVIRSGGSFSLNGPLDMENDIIKNIGDAGTDFTAGGGLTLADHIKLPATKAIFFDGGDHTYIQENPANIMTFTVGGDISLQVSNSGISTYSDLVPKASAGANTNWGTAANYCASLHYSNPTEHSMKEPKDKSGKYIDKLKAISIEDKSTFPIDVYVPAPIAKKDVYENGKIRFKKGEKMGDDGIAVSQLRAYMLKTILELEERIQTLEGE